MNFFPLIFMTLCGVVSSYVVNTSPAPPSVVPDVAEPSV